MKKKKSIIYTDMVGLGMRSAVILFYAQCIVICRMYYASNVVYTWMLSYAVMLMIYERVCNIFKGYFCFFFTDQMVLTMMPFFFF